jgi:SAM-dependent methyltransferase
MVLTHRGTRERTREIDAMSRLRASAGALKRGLGGLYRRSQRRLAHLAFERGLESTESIDISSGHLYLHRGLRGTRVGPRDVFVDYGSGKGRVLLHASRRPFARVIGIELDPEDCAFARRNLAAAAAARRVRAAAVEVLEVDASSWPVPDDVTVVYMFNPFKGEVFAAVVSRLIESLDRRPRPLTLVYANPECSAELLATGRFERVRSSRWPRPDKPKQRVEVFGATVGAR